MSRYRLIYRIGTPGWPAIWYAQRRGWFGRWRTISDADRPTRRQAEVDVEIDAYRRHKPKPAGRIPYFREGKAHG